MPTLEDGQLFERYRINRWLGGGIAGESYEAEDRILQRKVTLKLIHPWATLPDSARRQFFREMQGISLLNHSYLAAVLDYGELDGRIYVVRRYVSSGSLLGANGRLWFHPPLPVADALKYVHQLAQALQYIHQHGYLHGSLALGNVLVLRGPNAEDDSSYAPFLIADVGLSNFVRRFGSPRIGTLPVSAAPEQLGKRVTPASDQFALAVLLYFWLSGRPPYLGTPDEVEQLKLSETVTPLSMLNPGISLEQDGIILSALAASPEKRHATVLAFAEALMDSLNSPVQHFALAASAEVERQEMPPEFLHASPDGFSTIAPLEATETNTTEQPRLTTEASAEAPSVQETEAARPDSGADESYLAPLEGLPPIPQTEPGSASPLREIDPASFSQTEANHLPSIPETPQLEEGAFPIEIEFVLSSPAETAASQSSQPVPQVDTEAATELPVPASEIIKETPTEPSARAEMTTADEQPVAQEENSPNSLQEELAGAAPEIAPAPVASLGETSAPTDENTPISPADEVSPTTEEVSAPTAENTPIPPVNETLATTEETPSELLAIAEEVAPAASQEPEEVATVDSTAPDNPSPSEAESLPVAPPDEQAATTGEDSVEDAETVPLEELATPNSVNATDDIAPTVPLEELAAPAEEAAPASSPEQTELPSDDRITLEDTPVPALEESATDDTQAQAGETLPASEEALQASDEPTSESAGNDSPASPAPVVEADAIDETDAGPRSQETEATTSEIYQPAEATLAAPRLIVSSPYTNSSYEYLLANGETNIGRAGASDLVLEQDDLTSRHHALLKRTGEHVLIFDKRSHNGVFINGQKIEAGRGYELADGDHIGIGNYELIFRSASGSQVSQLI